MADTKISALTSATTPLAGTEVLPIVQSSATKKVAVSDLTAGRSISTTGVTVTGTGSRITGDFSNATPANRLVFQSSTTDGVTGVYAIPNGAAQIAAFSVASSSALTNCQIGSITQFTTDLRFNAAIIGSASYVPMTFYTGGAERMQIDTVGRVGIGGTPTTHSLEVNGTVSFGSGIYTGSGVSTGDVVMEMGGNRSGSGNCYIDLHATSGSDYECRILRYGGTNGAFQLANTGTGVFQFTQAGAGNLQFETSNTERFRIDSNGNTLVVGAGGLGYGTGSGGAQTQTTGRTSGVTLNKTNGAITLVSAAGSTTWQTFTVTNSTVAATDTIIVNQKSGTDLYEIHVTAVAAGSFNISFRTTGGTTTEQPVFNFAVIKAVTA